MSRMIREPSRRRASLLATTSFVAASILTGAGALTVSVTPSVALANSCGAIPLGGTVICNPPTDFQGAPYDRGITYTGVATNNTFIILNDVQVTDTGASGGGNVSNPAGDGVQVTSALPLNLLVGFENQGIGGGPTTVAGNTSLSPAYGIDVESAGGNVAVNTLDISPDGKGGFVTNDVANTVTGNIAINAVTSGTGNSNVTIGKDTITGLNGNGIISSATGSGDSTVTVGAGGVVSGSGNSYAVFDNSATGNATLNLNGDLGSGGEGFSVTGNVATANIAGNVTTAQNGTLWDSQVVGTTAVLNQTAGTISSTGSHLDGAVVVSAGAGGASLNTSAGADINAAGATGLATTSSGNVTGTLNGNISGDWAVTTAGTGTASVNLAYGGNFTGTNGGILQTTVSGANTLHLTSTGIADGGGGGNAAIQVTSSAGGNVSVTTDLGSTTTASGGPGIVSSTTGSATVQVVANGNVSGGGGSGISATGGTGNVSVATGNGTTVSGTSGGSAAGVTASGAGNVTVTANGAVSGTTSGAFTTGTGIHAATTGGSSAVNVTVGANGSASGVSVFNANAVGISTSAVNGVTTINVSGAVSGGTGFLGSSAGISAGSSGTTGGDINITTHPGGTITTSDFIFGAGGDGIDASTAGGNITIATGDLINTTGTAFGRGIVASVGAGGGNGTINIDVAGPTNPETAISSAGTGIFAINNGTGNINITTEPGQTISTATADGIDGHATGGGSVTVNLLDGAINANTSHSSGIAPAINLSAVGAGNVIINAHDTQTNFGGNGDQTTTVNGTNEVGISASLTNQGGFFGGDGVNASSSGAGNVIVSGFNGFIGNVTTPDSGLLAGEGVSGAISNVGGADIRAITTGSGNVTVQTVAGGTLDGNATIASTDGVIAQAQGTSGNVTVNIGDSIGAAVGGLGELNNGVDASITNAANGGNVVATVGTNVTGADNANITINAGNVGVSAVTVGGGSATATIGSAGHAVSITAGNIAVNVNSTTGPATVAGTDVGTLTVTGGANPVVNVTSVTGNVSVGNATTPFMAEIKNQGTGVGINATTGANVFANAGGNITTAAGDGIDAISTGTGAVTVNYGTTNAGNFTISSGGTYGILASIGNATDGQNVTVNLGNAATATTITMTNTTIPTIGVEATTTGTGNVLIHSNGGVTVDPTEYGMEAQSPSGQAKIATGTGDSYTVNDPGFVAPEHIGLYAHSGAAADPVAGPSALVTIAGNNTISVEASGNSTDGSIGVAAVNLGNGTGSAVVNTTGGGLSLTVDGSNTAGIAATTAGFDGVSGFDAATGSGNVTVNTGTGQIAVGGPTSFNLVGGNTNFSQSYGVFTNTNGGNISVDNNANITVQNSAGFSGLIGTGTGTVGIYSTTKGAGNIDIGAPTAGTLITTQVGDGILAVHNGPIGSTGNVTVGGGVNGVIQQSITTGEPNLSGSASGNGIRATSNGVGTVSVDQGNLSTITTLGTSGQNAGIYADNTAGPLYFGNVTVQTDGKIVTNAGGGTLNVATGAITVGGQGVIATTSGNGELAVNQASTGNITTLGASDGIDVSNTSASNGDIAVTLAGHVTAGAAGVVAISTTNDDIAVTLHGATVVANGGNGIDARIISGKSGTVTVATNGNSSITASGAGVLATTNGAGAVTVDNGFVPPASPTGVGGNISAGLDGILATNTFAGNSGAVSVDNEGNITHSGAIGIDAEVISAANNASVFVTTGSISSVGDGVLAQTAGKGNVNVTVNAKTNGAATLVTSSLGNGVEANALGGGNTFVDAEGAVHGDAGIVATALLNGTTNVLANANVTAGGDAIFATTQNGLDSVHVGNLATVASTSGDGINARTVLAGNGSILIQTDAGTTVTGGNLAGNDGIHAQPTGSGAVTVLANGAVGTHDAAAAWGINAIGNGGLVTVTQGATGNVTDGGISATNTTGAAGDVIVTASGSVNNTARQGIFANVTSGVATVNLNGAGAVTANTVAGQNGVEVDTTTGQAIFNGQAGTKITATGNGLLIQATQPGGTISVNERGTVNATGNLAGTAGIDASTVNTDINITTFSNTITGANGILTSTGGPANTTINTGTGAITGTTFAGIESTTIGTGGINITSIGPINGAAAGIVAEETNVANAAGITIHNSGPITVSGAGNIAVPPGFLVRTTPVSGNLSFGIAAFDAGPGDGTIVNSGVIDPAAIGIGMEMGGNVTVTNTGNVTATNTGIFAESTGGQNVTVSSNGAAAFIAAGNLAAGGDGIDAFSFGAGGGTVQVGASGAPITSNITAHSRGIDAEGNATVSVWASGNVTAFTDDGILALSTPGASAATVLVNTGPGAVTGTSGIVASTAGTNAADTVTVNVGGNVTATSGNGVQATGINGLTNVNLNTGNVSATGGDGLQANSTGTGGVLVTTAAGTTVSVVTGGTNDIRAISSGASGNVTVTSAAALTASGGGDTGIRAETIGANTVGNVLVANSGVVNMTGAGSIGIDAEVAAAGSSGNVTLNNTGNVTANAAGSFGVVGQISGGAADTGAVRIDNEAAAVSANAVGVFGFSNGAGPVTVTSSNTAPGAVTGGFIGIEGAINNAASTSAVTIVVGNVSGNIATTITGNGGATTGAGIYGTTNGTGNVSVTAYAGATVLAPNNDGILATSTGAGSSVNVTSGATVTAGNIGIATSDIGSGATVISSSGVVTGGVSGIAATSSGAGPITITNTGAVTGTSHNGIDAESASGAVTVNSTGPSIAAGHDGIFASTTGAITITNTSAISGPGGGKNLLTNGGFETGTFSGWTIGAGTNATNVETAGYDGENPHSGTYFAALGDTAGTYPYGTLSQTVSDTPGQNLTLSYYLESDGALPNYFDVNWNGALVPGSLLTGVADQRPGYVHYTFNLLGTGSDTVLFHEQNVPAYWAFDDVSLSAGAILANAGIEAQGGSGVISIVNSGDMSALGGANFGIVAVDTTGQIGITNTANIGAAGAGAGVNMAGIYAQSIGANTAGITVNNSGNIWVNGGPATYGILASNAGIGAVVVNNSGNIDPALYGIYATGGGNSTVNNTGATVIGNIGIHNDTQGNATFTAQTNVGNATVASVVTGLTGNAIEGFGNASGGNVGVDATHSGAITGATNGIYTQTTGAGTITVNTLNPVPAAQALTLGQGGDGIDAITSGNGLITVVTGPVTGQGAAGHVSDGVLASSTGGSSINVTTTGAIAGDSTGNAAATGASGILATTSGGNGSVSVAVNAQTTAPFTSSVTGGNWGILATSAGAGHTTVTVGGAGANLTPVSATGGLGVLAGRGPVGIAAIGGNGTGGLVNGVTLTTWSNITAANGRAIVSSSGGNASITINDDTIAGVLHQTVVKGLGDATAAFGGTAAGNVTHAVIDVTTASGSVTTLTNSGLVESVNGPGAASYGDLAVKASTGGLAVSNTATGTILGRVWAGNVTAANPVSISNSGTWHTTGTSMLGAGADTVTNNAGGYIGTAAGAAPTTLAFGAGTNTLTNAAGAVIVAGEAPLSGTAAAPAVTNITGTVTFTNNGVLVLGGSSAGSDGKIDAVVNATGTTIGGTGLIDLDANLWSDTQSAAACSALSLTAADCLVVAGSTGNNGLRVTDTLAHSVGAFNPTGIVIVSGSSAASTFHLDAGSTWFNAGGAQFGGATNVLDKPGLFFYDLAYNSADSTERLISVPKAAAFEFASLGGASNDIWYTTTQVWFDRQADLRDTLEGRPSASQPGIWLKMIGDFNTRKGADVFTEFNKTYAFDVSYTQDTAALIGGLDLLNVTDKDRAWVIGIQGGSVDSNVNFRASPDRFHLSGGDIGAYATYLSGGLFIDGTVNANLMTLRGQLPTLSGTPSTLAPTPFPVSDRVTTVGGQVESGYEMPLGPTAFWEPLGVLAYVNTRLTDIPLPGGIQSLGHADSFRGSLGARVGTTMSYQYYKVKFAITGRVWDEFNNNTLSSLQITGGPNFLNNDNLHGVFGDISGQANLFSTTSGLSAFLNAGVKFKTNYTDGTITLGARYQW